MTDYGIYGDSIAYGYGSGGYSWFDKLTAGKNATKLARNGAKITDVSACLAKADCYYQNLFLAVGINDLLQPQTFSGSLDIVSILRSCEEMLTQSSKMADQVTVQAVLPVREELFPEQDWLDKPMWAFNNNIRYFNSGLQVLAHKYNIKFVDAYTGFENIEPEKYYVDAVHPNIRGQDLLYRIYLKHL